VCCSLDLHGTINFFASCDTWPTFLTCGRISLWVHACDWTVYCRKPIVTRWSYDYWILLCLQRLNGFFFILVPFRYFFSVTVPCSRLVVLPHGGSVTGLKFDGFRFTSQQTQQPATHCQQKIPRIYRQHGRCIYSTKGWEINIPVIYK